MSRARQYVEDCADMYGLRADQLVNHNIEGGTVGYFIVDYPDPSGKSWILELGFAEFVLRDGQLINEAHNIVAQHTEDHEWVLTHLGTPLQVIEMCEARLD